MAADSERVKSEFALSFSLCSLFRVFSTELCSHHCFSSSYKPTIDSVICNQSINVPLIIHP